MGRSAGANWLSCSDQRHLGKRHPHGQPAQRDPGPGIFLLDANMSWPSGDEDEDEEDDYDDDDNDDDNDNDDG